MFIKVFQKYHLLPLLFSTLFITSCATRKPNPEASVKIKFLDEYIIPEDLIVKGTKVGGLSDLDYDGEKFYAVCDLPSSPRIYKFKIDINDYKIDSIQFLDVIKIPKQSHNGTPLRFDSEGLIYDSANNLFILSSEGLISQKKDPFIVELDTAGIVNSQYEIPNYFKANYTKGPRNNGVFEGLDQSYDKKGIWVSTELPLKMDGPEAKLYRTKSSVRFTYYSQETKQPEKQFVYQLDRLRKVPFLPFGLSGVSAIMVYKPDLFFVLERSFSAGHGRHGFRARLYLVDAHKATNTLTLKNIHKKLGKEITPANKKLIFDFNSIRKQLSHKSVDNLEGIALGPRLPNGHQSLIVIADNNFSSFTKEMNQVILLEIIPQ